MVIFSQSVCPATVFQIVQKKVSNTLSFSSMKCRGGSGKILLLEGSNYSGRNIWALRGHFGWSHTICHK